MSHRKTEGFTRRDEGSKQEKRGERSGGSGVQGFRFTVQGLEEDQRKDAKRAKEESEYDYD